MRDGQVSILAGGAGAGQRDGICSDAQFNNPHGIAMSQDGSVIVADMNNHLIRAIDVSGNVTTLAGSGTPGSDDGDAALAQFSQPSDLALASDGTVWVIDQGNHTIRKITSTQQVETPSYVAGSPPVQSMEADAEARLFFAIGYRLRSKLKLCRT